jgi:hypothetical protein
VVRLPETPDQWCAALTECLRPGANSTEQRAARQTVARRHDWDVLVRQIAETIAARLGPDFSDFLARYFASTREESFSLEER